MKVALLHYWLVRMRGGEKVLKELCTLFPSSDIYAHVYDAEGTDHHFRSHRVSCSLIARLPASKKYYSHYLPLMPLASRMLNLEEYPLIVSSESGPIKGIRKPRGSVHICYCHTPMRYVWDMYDDYLSWASLPVRMCMPALTAYLRSCDVKSADSVDHFAANSRFVAARIKRAYGRESVVIYPPVDTEFFGRERSRGKQDYYLVCGHLNRYKRADLAVEAFNRNGRQLVIVGTGEEYGRLRKSAGKNVTFLGGVDDERLARVYAEARALIFPGTEDFGMVPVEAQAAGTPVIAYQAGGVLETVIEGKTGLFFPSQTVESLCNAVEEFESRKDQFDGKLMKQHVSRFSAAHFRKEFSDLVEKALGTSFTVRERKRES